MKLLKDSLNSAADEQKQLERASALFQDSAKGIAEFSVAAATSLGLSSSSALKFTNDLGQMLVPLGIAPKSAAAMSVELTKLVGNLASLRNEDPTVVLDKIESGLRGRGAGLKAYGITVNDVTLKEEALRLGLIRQQADAGKVQTARSNLAIATANLAKAEKDYAGQGATTQVETAKNKAIQAQNALNKAIAGSIPELTQQQKSIAAVNLILQKGARYQDEFGKHTGDLANQQRILRAEISNLEGDIGRALLPEVTKITAGMAAWLSKSENQATVQHAVVTAVHDLGVALRITWDVLKTGVAIIKPVVDAVGGLKNAIKLLIALKVALWVNSVIVPALARASTAWAATGTAATVAATKTTVATAAMRADMVLLSRSSATTAVTGQVAGIGTAAVVSQGKLAGLARGLGGLAKIGAITIGIDLLFNAKGDVSLAKQALGGALVGFGLGGPAGALAGLSFVGGTWLGKKLKGAMNGKQFDPSKVFDTSIDVKGGEGIYAPEDGVVVHVGVAGQSGGNMKFYQVVFVGESGASYTLTGVLRPAKLGPHKKGVPLGIGPPGGHVGAHYAPPVTARQSFLPSGGISTPPGGAYQGSPSTGSGTKARPASGQSAGLSALQGFLTTSGGSAGSNAMSAASHTGTSFHYKGEALDIGDGSGSEGSGSPDNPQALVATWNLLAANVGHLAELFWNYGGFYKWGRKIGGPGSDAIPHHRKHIHVAFTGSPEEVARTFGISTPGSGEAAYSAAVAAAAAADSGTGALVVGAKDGAPTTGITAAPAWLRTTIARAGATPGLRDDLAAQKTLLQVYLDRLKKKGLSAAEKADLEEAKSAVQQKIRDIQRQIADAAADEARKAAAARVHEGLVDQVIAGMGFGASVMATRGAEVIRATYEKLTNAVLKAKLAAQKKAKAQIAALAKTTQTGVGEATDVIGSLLGLDPAQVVTTQDKWGRAVTTTIGAIVVKAQKALRDMNAALANKTGFQAAINEWEALGPELSAAIGASLDAAAAVVQARQSVFETAFGAVSSRIGEAFNRETQRVLGSMGQALSDQIGGLQTQLADRLESMQSELAKKVAQLQAKGALLTPAEQAIKNLQAQAGADTATADLQAAHAALLAAKQGSPEAIAAQKQIDALMLQQKIAGLQVSADAERAARDRETQAQIDSLTARFQAREKELRDEEAALEESLRREETLREQNYQDQRDNERALLDSTLAGWLTRLKNGSAKWSEFADWLKGEGVSGDFGPNPIVAMTEAGQAQGSAFAEAYIAELQAAFAAQQALANGQDPAAAAAAARQSFGGTGSQFGGPGGFLGGGEIPGPYTGRDDKFALVSGGETVIDTKLTDALKRVFLGGGQGGKGMDALAELLFDSLTEHKKQTALLGRPLSISANGRTANDITFEASR